MVVTNNTVEMTRDEIVRAIDDGARRRRNMSAAELIRAYRRCELDDPGPVADLIALSYLLRDEDPLFADAG
jgi:hypothetical protein